MAVKVNRSTFLSFSPPCIGQEEIQQVIDTLSSPWITTGPKTKLFEKEFASYVAAPSALALNSCTAGLHTALATLGVGPGDEVITTPMTFAATVNVIEHVGARPVLVDVEPDTLNIDPKKIEEKITPHTRAIIPVHYAGHPAELDPIRELSARYRLWVIEDAAHALPAKYRGYPIGSSSNPVSFSFYATKNLTTGEGGMLTGEHTLMDEARCTSLHGMSRDAWKRYEKGASWYYEVTRPGYKYNMTDIQAGIGLAQLRHLDEFEHRRREVVHLYNDAFSKVEALQIPVERPYVEHAWHLYVLRLRPEMLSIDRDRFIEELTERQVGTSVHFIPIHLHPYYRDRYGYAPEDFPVALSNYQRMLSLPLHPRLSDDDVYDVIDAVLDLVHTFAR